MFKEYIASFLWTSVEVSDGNAVNKTTSELWYPSLLILNWQCFFGDNVSVNKRFPTDIHFELN